MKRFFLLSFLFLPIVIYASELSLNSDSITDFREALRRAYKKLEFYRNERMPIFNRLVVPPPLRVLKQGEDFKIINMNLTILPTLGNSTDESSLIVNDQILIRVTGVSPLTDAVFYSKSYKKISVDSPDTEVTYKVEPYFYDENISIITVSFKNPPVKDTILRINITTEGKPICEPSPFLGLVTCQYNKELSYDLSVLHPMRADGREDAYSFDVSIIVPDGYYTTASGEFVGSVENGDGTKTELWHNDIAQFVAFGMARFDIYSTEYEGENGVKFPINSYVLPQRADKARGFHPLIGSALNWYSKRFYPYQFPVISFGEISSDSDAAYATPMAQFIPSYLIDKGAEDYEAIDTFAHEVSHQWWGFMVMGSIYEFPWINEGFAEFSSMEFSTRENILARAFMYGVYAFLYFHMIDPEDDVPICSEEVYKNDFQYVLLTYYKGALVLAQLSNIMGEEFYKSLSRYVSKNLFQFTNIATLKEAFKEVTGDDYSWYFDKWLYSAGYPIYTVKYDVRKKDNKNYVDVFISQAASTYKSDKDENVLFDMPVDVAFLNENRTEVKRVTERINEQTFEKSYEFDGDISGVLVDPSIKIYLKRMRSALKGDINIDMEVDGRDVLFTAYSYGYNWYSYFEKEGARFLPNADIDMNGVVDDNDLSAVVDNFGKCLLSSCK